MFSTNKLFSLLFIYTAICAIQFNNITLALPGQNLEAITKWMAGNSYLTKLEKVIDKTNNEISYLSFFKDDEHSFFAFYTDRKGIIDTEIISVSEDSTIKFWATKNDDSIQFIYNFYNPEIAKDFQDSKFIFQSTKYKYKDKNEDASVKIYKGQLFVYICEEHTIFDKNLNKTVKSSNFKLTPVNYLGSTLKEFKKFFK